MTRTEAIDAGDDWRRVAGAKFITSVILLHGFCAHTGVDRAVPSARVVSEVAYDAFPSHDIDEIRRLDRARTLRQHRCLEQSASDRRGKAHHGEWHPNRT